MPDIQDDEPLDPQVEAIRKRLVRLLAVSGGIMLVGLMTVVMAIVYKLQTPERIAADPQAPVEIVFPAGSELLTSQADEDGLSVTIKLDDGTIQTLRYAGDGTPVAIYSFTTD